MFFLIATIFILTASKLRNNLFYINAHLCYKELHHGTDHLYDHESKLVSYTTDTILNQW